MTLSTIIGQVNESGEKLAYVTRHRLRASFIAAKMQAKVQEWTDADDKAFDAIDDMTKALAHDAGFLAANPQLGQDVLEKLAASKGFRLVSVAPPLMPASAPPPQSFAKSTERPKAPFDLEGAVKDAATDREKRA